MNMNNKEDVWNVCLATLGISAVWLFWPEIVQAAITFGDMGQNVADSARGVAKGITLSGYAGGVGMASWGVVEMYKASKVQGGGQHTYGSGMMKIIAGALALGIGEFVGSGSATLFGSDQTTGLDELGLR